MNKEKIIALRADADLAKKIDDLKEFLDRNSNSDLIRALINWAHKNFLKKNEPIGTK